MGLRLFFLPNFPGPMFIQGATFIPDSRVAQKIVMRTRMNNMVPLMWTSQLGQSNQLGTDNLLT